MSINIQDLREHLGEYFLAVNPGYQYVDFQQTRIIPALEAVERGEIKRLMIFMPPGHLCSHDTIVPTLGGWKEHGDLKPGDFVFDQAGQPTPVIAESPVAKADVRVTLSDGSEFFVHENHEWTIFDRANQQWRTVKTRHFFRTSKFGRPLKLLSGNRGQYQLPLRGAVQYPERELPLHPYVLGAWLGDGTSTAPHITYPEKDSAIIFKIESLGFVRSSTWCHKDTGVLTCSFGGARNQAGKFRDGMRNLGLHGNKHIPDIYKITSIEQRIDLLAGLVDTDGYKDKDRGRYRIVTTNKRLADDMADVIRSLGWHPCVSVGKLYNPPGATIISKQTPYYVGFSPTCKLSVALERKQLGELALRRRTLFIAEVEKVGGTRKGKCIEVASPNGLYMIGKNYVLTHNSKSDNATRTFIPWYMGRHPERNSMVCSYSADLASDDFGARIKARMQSDLHLRVFPKSKLTQDSRSKTHLTTVSGGNFYSVGFTGGLTGKRLDLLVMDDLTKSYADADSGALQESLFADYKGTVKDRLKPDGAIVLCQHRWRERDIAGRILELDGRVENGGAWTVLKLPAEDPPDSGNFLWERKTAADSGYPRDYYLDFKKDDLVWWGKFQQEPGASKNIWFREEWLQFYDIPIPRDKYNTYMLVDPAGAKGKKSDWTSIQVWAAGQDKKLFLADWIHDRLDPGERVATILRLTRYWKQQQTIYEEYGLLNDSYYLTEKMREQEFDVRVYPIPVGRTGPRHNLSKSERIKGIIPLFREGNIYLPRTCKRKIYDGTTVDLTKRFIDVEYKLYKGEGSIQHEDDLDCMGRLLEPELVISYFEPKEEREAPRSAVPQGASWQSVY